MVTFRRLAQGVASSFRFTIVTPAVIVLVAWLLVAVESRRRKCSVRAWRWRSVFRGSDFFRGGGASCDDDEAKEHIFGSSWL